MATIDEIFATMTVDENTLATDEVLVIDPNTRQINIPGSELVFGVESDTGAERKYFMAPRYVGNNLDLASCFIRVNYRNANGEIDAHLVQDVVATEDNIQFSWELARKVTLYKGQVAFVVCAVRPDSNGKLLNEWNTTLATGMVLAGLEPDSAVIEAETKDVVAQLLALVEAQSANVEAVGAEQVAKVKSAAQNAQADAVAQIEAKGASTLATIPGEYTATVRAVQGAANAIRKKVSGEVIRVDDVSPMEHYPEIRVAGKNLFDTSKIAVQPSTYSIYVSSVGVGYIEITDTESYDGNGHVTTDVKLREICPQMRAGKRYIISATSTAWNKCLYLKQLELFWQFGSVITLTEEMLDCTVGFYGFAPYRGQEHGTCRISNIQVEEGEVATDYTPYIDPTTVTVRRCSKNLLPYPFYEKTKTYNGVTFTDNRDGSITVNGTATSQGAYFLFYEGGMYLKGTYTLSGMTGGSGETYFVQPKVDGVYGSGLIEGSRAYQFDGIVTQFLLNVAPGATVENLKIKLMLEEGDTATAYEPYNGETQIPSSDGTVSGLSAVSPTMTLMTDTPGVNIECEYSRDTNVVVNEILEMISALTSGT